MVIDIVEYKIPGSVDKDEVEEFVEDIVIPNSEKAGFKNIRVGWVVGEEEENIGIFIGEMDSLEELETYRDSEEHKKFHEEVEKRFPGIEEKGRIVEVIE